eukprot:TRINITY_DN20440_c0_g1_i1.p1 TRINITY_DN20440_c0_g1~~TRINITY_DN20440_c0_g1_i1.p1  ORF type:complete len:408 (+),score=86.50 TRINITY_DN20440_c0_g1_i1:193-1416(+)
MEKEENPTQQKLLIKVPSYQEVLEKSEPKSLPSIFRPSLSTSSIDSGAPSSSSASTFSQAFSFVKQTEFYTSPPAVSQPPDPPSSSHRGNVQFSSMSQGQNGIIVSRRQQGNPLLKHVRNVRWTFGDILPDYLLGANTCALYISLRYHLLHPDYIYYRIRELQRNYRLRIVLCHVDVEDVVKPLHEVTRTAVFHDCTLLCGWSLQECARYLETIKAYEKKPADMIQERLDNDYLSRLTNALTSVHRINKCDVVTLGANFGTLAGIFGASMDELARCPGIGERKVKRLYDAFHEPFKRTVKKVHASNDCEPSNEGKELSDNQESSKTEGNPSNNNEAKKPSLSVKSALKSAYEKYWDKLRPRDIEGPKTSGDKESSLDNPVEEREMEHAKDKSPIETSKLKEANTNEL